METTRVFPDAITCKGSGIGVASYGDEPPILLRVRRLFLLGKNRESAGKVKSRLPYRPLVYPTWCELARGKDFAVRVAMASLYFWSSRMMRSQHGRWKFAEKTVT